MPARVEGVYFLFNELGQLLYVGRTTDLHRRLVRHRERGELAFSKFAFIECPDPAERVRLEADYIRIYSPPHNSIRYGAPSPLQKRRTEWHSVKNTAKTESVLTNQ
jgi:hypothetical protein